MEISLFSSTDADLESTGVPMHSVTRWVTQDRTAQRIAVKLR